MSELLDLAARCEAASGPDRRLDALIEIALRPDAPHIIGHKPGRFPQEAIWGTSHDFKDALAGGNVDKDFIECAAAQLGAAPVTDSIDAAASLVPDGFNYGAGSDSICPEGPPGWAWVTDQDNFEIVRAATPANALTAASLRALAAKEVHNVK